MRMDWETRACGWLVLGALVASSSKAAGQEREGREAARAAALVLEGFVVGPDGNPVEGARVACSGGGTAVTDAAGRYELATGPLPEGAGLEVVATGTSGTNGSASAVVLPGAGGPQRVDPLRLARGGSCTSGWMPTFGGEPGVNGIVNALVVHDDGSGPALFVGGDFSSACGTAASHVAKWDGTIGR
jgi:hypothetical protein